MQDRETEIKLNVEIEKVAAACSISVQKTQETIKKLRQAFMELSESRPKIDMSQENIKAIQEHMIAVSQAGVKLRNESERFLNKPGKQKYNFRNNKKHIK